jgi:hypothetical protein
MLQVYKMPTPQTAVGDCKTAQFKRETIVPPNSKVHPHWVRFVRLGGAADPVWMHFYRFAAQRFGCFCMLRFSSFRRLSGELDILVPGQPRWDDGAQHDAGEFIYAVQAALDKLGAAHPVTDAFYNEFGTVTEESLLCEQCGYTSDWKPCHDNHADVTIPVSSWQPGENILSALQRDMAEIITCTDCHRQEAMLKKCGSCTSHLLSYSVWVDQCGRRKKAVQ